MNVFMVNALNRMFVNVNQACPNGRYGPKCDQECSCENEANCDPVDGHCNCLSGWIGKKCDQPCPPGKFGHRCIQLCQCEHGDCDHIR
ncbi:hypothetical protein QR98_0103480 [Sarcoptes scabiei]|uniref:Uncharacterized protein n=1 Tax=Sarcoptes scabiei TaxID=52283 RepID=A0A132ALI2_SARSC|nr:hypothetical protein QR98_0103480 [Sarcoptes scabiei]